MIKTATFDGWLITDNSVDCGHWPDRTKVTEWHLTKGMLFYKISEVFGDWAIDNQFVTDVRAKMDSVLVARGMPTVGDIEEALGAS